jgi:hypothetical protein
VTGVALGICEAQGLRPTMEVSLSSNTLVACLMLGSLPSLPLLHRPLLSFILCSLLALSRSLAPSLPHSRSLSPPPSHLPTLSLFLSMSL